MTTNLLATRVQQSLSSTSDLPTDVKFLFKEEAESGTIVKEIRAHKLILALVSNVFKTGFFGGIVDDGDIIIKDASKEAFEVMIEFIYNKISDVSSYEFDILCETYYLADKYNIFELEKETLRSIRSKDIGAGNALKVANLAEHYSAHEELSEILYKAVSHELSTKFEGNFSNAAEFFKNIDADATPISSKSLLRILGGLKTVPSASCGNCRASPCRSGSKVTKDHFVPGAKVSAAAVVPNYLGFNVAVEKLGQMTGNGTFMGATKDGLTLPVYVYLHMYVYNCKDT